MPAPAVICMHSRAFMHTRLSTPLCPLALSQSEIMQNLAFEQNRFEYSEYLPLDEIPLKSYSCIGQQVMRRISWWFCTTLRVPTSTQGGARAMREFPAPPAFVLVLHRLTSFHTHFRLLCHVKFAILSCAWKTPGAQIGNAKETMRIALRSFAVFLGNVVLQPHVH